MFGGDAVAFTGKCDKNQSVAWNYFSIPILSITMAAPDFTKQSLIPHLCVVGGLDAIAYYQKAFGAKILGEPFLADDKKRVMHTAIDVS